MGGLVTGVDVLHRPSRREPCWAVLSSSDGLPPTAHAVELLTCLGPGMLCFHALLCSSSLMHDVYHALTGVRLVVEVRRGFSPQLVLNQLYKSTRLQLRFSTNMVRAAWGGRGC